MKSDEYAQPVSHTDADTAPINTRIILAMFRGNKWICDMHTCCTQKAINLLNPFQNTLSRIGERGYRYYQQILDLRQYKSCI